MIVVFETESGRLVTDEIYVRTGVAYEVRTEVVGETGSAMIGLDQNLVRKHRRPPGRHDHARLRRAVRAGVRHRAAALGRRRPSRAPSTARASGTATPRSRCARPASRPSGPARRSRSHWSPRPATPVADDRAGHHRPDLSGAGREARPRPADVLRDDQRLRAARHRGRPRLLLDRAVAQGRLHPVLPAPADRRRRGPPAQEGGGRRRRGDRLDHPAEPLGRAGRGPAPGRRAVVEAGHPDRRRPRGGGPQLRVQRPARGPGDRRGDVPAVDGRAAADLRARGHPADPRAAPGRLHRGRPRRGRA